jgi:hypothetical protein
MTTSAFVIITMKTATVLAAFVGSAAAFAPTQTGKASTKLAAASFDDEIGITATPGMWDPLNFVDGDQARFDRLRSVEIKHGRVAMLAILGYATTWGNPSYRFPGCEDFPAGHEAVLKIPPVDLLAPILGICAFLELVVFKQKEGSFPGDMGGGSFPVGFGPFASTEEEKTKLRTNELLNGRAAQMGILGALVHEQLNGKPFIFFDHFEAYTPLGDKVLI